MAGAGWAVIDVTRCPVLSVPHGFLGSSVDGGSGADAAVVTENRATALSVVAPGKVFTPVKQIHSARCEVVLKPWPGEPPQADAIVTTSRDLALGIVTADCAPVLLADESAGVIGAAHAGWRGAVGGVIEATVAAMAGLGARRARIVAAIGPTIGQASYEVSAGFEAPFLAQDAANERFFKDGRAGHLHFDLPGYVAAQLREAGVATVWCADLDTCALPDRFFSYRRSTLAGENGYGRNLSLIAPPDRL